MSVFGGKLITSVRVHRAGAASSRSGRTSRPPPPAGVRSVEVDRRRRAAAPAILAGGRGRRAGQRGRGRRPDRGGPDHRGRAAAASAAPEGFALVERAGRARSAARSGRRARPWISGWIRVQPADRPDRQDRQARAVPGARASAARSSTRSGCRPPGTIVAVNRDPDAPIAEFADLARRRRPVRGGAGPPRAAPRPARLSRTGQNATMEITVLLPIAAFIALAAGLAVVLRGTGRIVARTRELEQFRTPRHTTWRPGSTRRSAAPPAQIDAGAPPASRPGHDQRRHLMAATDAVARYTDEAQALRGPRQTNAIRSDLVGELERASRALWHGRARGGDPRVESRSARARGADLDQARLPEPAARPRGDRPACPRRGRPAGRGARLVVTMAARLRSRARPSIRPFWRATDRPGPHHVVVSCSHTTIPCGAARQERDALSPMRRAGDPRRRLARPR